MQTSTALDEIVDFIAGSIPEKILGFQASEKTKQRAFFLVSKQKNESLTTAEKSELDHYLVLEHLMRLAKAKAYKMLNS